MSVQILAPDATTAPLLAGAGFADAYRLVLEAPGLDANAAAQRIFSRTPRWIRALLALRNRLGALIGLKGADENALDSGLPVEKRRRIGLFPIVAQAQDRVVLGFDDWHLDFRVVVDVLPLGADRQQVTATTLVLTHNWIGRAYLAFIMPFHRAIMRTLLAQAAKP
jgi:Protein of unknown function (DUF2867)